MLINKAKKIAAPAKLKSASSAQMPQHYSIRNAPSAAPGLPQEIMEMIFEKCGPEVPAVNIHTRLMRNRHRNAARIQACFKGSLIRGWMRAAESEIWNAAMEFMQSETYDLMLANGELDGMGNLVGPNGRTKIQTLTRLHKRPFGGLSITLVLAPGFYFHMAIPQLCLHE